jgi:hypothetical protein
MKCNGQKPRFTKKNNNENERKMIEGWWVEATQLYGTLINYHTNLYALSSHDFLYGENPTKGFTPPTEMLALAQMNNDALLLSKFGIQTDAELTIIIPISMFAEAMQNPRAEPKSGDLIVLTELGWDRPGGGGYPNTYPTTQMTGLSTNEYCKVYDPDASLPTDVGYVSGAGFNPMDNWIRGPNVYQITERRDENIPSQINPLGAHIVWMIKCKRFDYSYEPNAPVEFGSDQVSDGTLYGKLSGGTQTPENPKPYDQNTSDETKKSWDYLQHGNKDAIYGDYG